MTSIVSPMEMEQLPKKCWRCVVKRLDQDRTFPEEELYKCSFCDSPPMGGPCLGQSTTGSDAVRVCWRHYFSYRKVDEERRRRRGFNRAKKKGH